MLVFLVRSRKSSTGEPTRSSLPLAGYRMAKMLVSCGFFLTDDMIVILLNSSSRQLSLSVLTVYEWKQPDFS